MPRSAEKGGDRIRIGTIQSNQVPSCSGLKTDPFSDDFSIQDFFTSIERRVAWFEQLLERAAGEKCQLAVITEDFTRLGSSMTFLDDRSIFRRGVEKQTSLIPQRLAALARKCSMHIVACYFALEGNDIYNVADLFGAMVRWSAATAKCIYRSTNYGRCARETRFPRSKPIWAGSACSSATTRCGRNQPLVVR